MPKTSKKAPTPDEIAEMASRGQNVSAFFTNKFTIVRPNISRQALIKQQSHPKSGI